MLGEKRFVGGVNGSEIVQIFHEHGGFHDVAHFQTRRLHDSLYVFQRLARLREPNLPPEGVRYTRKVTLVWCGFFIGNGAMALFTVLHGDMHLWTLWNGMVAYILMGTLMATEWLVRQRVIKKEMHND